MPDVSKPERSSVPKLEHPLNIQLRDVAADVSNLDTSSASRERHPENMPEKSVALDVLRATGNAIDSSDWQFWNMRLMLATFFVSKDDRW